MATTIYTIGNITLMDGTELEISPLKIKYLRYFMDKFEDVRSAEDDYEAIEALSSCAQICMKQFKPEIAVSKEVFEEYVDLKTIYTILDIAAGIKIDKESEEPVKKQAVDSGSTWENLDLAKLESEVFLLGIWKDYEELEKSMSMAELTATLNISRDIDYQGKKFMAAMQGVDLDKQSGKSQGDAWEEMKARVFSGGAAENSKDVLALQGINAQKAGFGIGMGLSYEKVE
jgi:hypothetical protein